jgi:hypothetical protein
VTLSKNRGRVATGSSKAAAFGIPSVPLVDLRKGIKHALLRARQEVSRAQRPTIGAFPMKRLRSNLAHAMSLDVVFQPVVRRPAKGSANDGIKPIENNPIWDIAPDGAYYKAKRFCSLLNIIVTHGHRARILHDLERLAINIWRMPLQAFNGLIKSIRCKIGGAARHSDQRRRPEALEPFGRLTKRPVGNPDRVYVYQPRKIRWKSEFSQLWLSTNVELVRLAHKLDRKASKINP